jgi:ABC-type branched-subunit amino acid transport system ATPase component/sugar phosphate permease
VSERNEALLDLAVPEDLLRTAIARTKTEEAVADVALMPGVGDGKPPPLLPLLRTWGAGGIGLMLTASWLVHSLESGIGILGPDIKKTFGLSDAGLGALIFVMSAAYFVLGIPVALWADRGRRTRVAAITLVVWAIAVPLMGLAPSVWVLAALLVVAGIGRAAPNSAHLSYLSDAYPVEARARVMALHQAARPLGNTIGAGLMGAIAAIAGGREGWRWAMGFGLIGFAVAFAIMRLREPAKGERERDHVLGAAGLAGDNDAHDVAPKILLGSALQRLMRVRTLYFMFIAIAILGFAAIGIPLIGNLYLEQRWDLAAGERAGLAFIVGPAALLGIPIGGLVGDRLFRRDPGLPLLLAGASLAGFGVIYSLAVHMPKLWMFVVGYFLAEACLAPLGTALTQTVAATAPPSMRSLTFALFGIYSLVFGGFAGAVILGAISDAKGPTFALTVMGPITIAGGILVALGARHVKGDITRAIEDILEEHQEQQRRSTGARPKALQVHNLDFAYGTQQVLFDVNLEVDEGEMVALLGTNGAGKSTLLRVVAGLEHPARGTVRIAGTNSTYLEAEQVMSLGVSMLPGGKMTFPSLTVEENLRAGSFAMRSDAGLAARLDQVFATFPVLGQRRHQKAGTLSGGEQQMLALGRALVHEPRVLLIDELTLGLAPKVVEALLEIVRAINARGTTVILVEQSVNLALTLADRSFFLERGEVRFEGSTAELLERDDLLRPIFLTDGGAS